MGIYCTYRVYTVYPTGRGEDVRASPAAEGDAPERQTSPGTPGEARRKDTDLDIIISNSSGKPIYEQITDQIKAAIVKGELAEGEQLPSIRALANSLRVSAITTKRAYADLEAAGLIETVQGKGSFVAGGNRELLREERLRHVESLLGQAAREAASAGVTVPELHEMLDLVADGGAS